MRAITEKDVWSWTPDMSARHGWTEVSETYGKTAKGKASDLRDYGVLVHIVRIVNFYDEEVYNARIAGDDTLVRNAADEMLNTFCRRYPGTPLKYRIERFVEKD